jgi:hypothetical protein
MRGPRGVSGVLRLAVATLLPLAGPLPVRSAAAADVEWNTELAFDERYDDNITRLSQKDLDRLGPTTGGTGLPCGSGNTDSSGHRFSITTPDDFISIPQLSSTVKAGWLTEMPTTFGLDLNAYQYVRNSIKNYQSYRLSIAQPLHPVKAHATSVRGSYSFLPRYFLRNLRSDRTAEDFAQMGIFILPPPRREATYRSETAELQIDQVILPDRLRFQGTFGKETRDYNRCFDERDSHMPYREAELAWNPRGNSRLRLRASYVREALRAKGDLADTAVFFESDISNVRDVLGGDVRFGWKRHGRSGWVALRYETERRDFKAKDPNDLCHFGRNDRLEQTGLSAQTDLSGGWLLAAEARHQSNKSTFPAPGGVISTCEEITNYDDNIVQVGFAYRFKSSRAGRERKPRPEAPSGQGDGRTP